MRSKEDERNVGPGGVSIEDFMAQFDEDMAPDNTLETSLASAERIEIITERDAAESHLLPEEEARQQLVIGRTGEVTFRSARYFKGKGHYSIGRYKTVRIASAAVKEIFHLLDTWLFVSGQQLWDPDAGEGSWLLRSVHEDGSVEMTRGSLEGAVFDGLDISDFIRQRIPIEDMFLFDAR